MDLKKWLKKAGTEITVDDEDCFAVSVKFPKSVKHKSRERYHSALAQLFCDYVNGDLVERSTPEAKDE